jgi:thioredoxin 1
MPADAPVPDAGTPQATVPYLDAERFTSVVEEARGLALIDFTAAWCPPCRILAPYVDALARELSPDIVVAKVDVDDQPDLASRFGVLSLPTLIFFQDGQVVDRIVGVVSPARLRARLDELRRPR